MNRVRRLFSWEVIEILPLLHKFNEECGYGYELDEGESIRELATMILSQTGVVFVHVVDDRIVGALGGQITTFPGTKAKRASESFFYIDPDHRGGTAAVRMVKGYIQWAWERGVNRCQMVALSSTDTEGKVRQFYEALGFTQVEMGFEIRKT